MGENQRYNAFGCHPPSGRVGAKGEEMKDWLMIASIGEGIVAAGLALIAANVPIRNEIDSFMNDIYRQGWWAACAAGIAALGVILQALHYFMTR